MKDKPNKFVLNALKALRIAVAKALAEHKRLGRPIYVWEDGKVVRIPARRATVRKMHPRKAA